jgi:hypothetical protein
MRLLPHDQDTGGFFIAVFRKIAPFKGGKTTKIFYALVSTNSARLMILI